MNYNTIFQNTVANFMRKFGFDGSLVITSEGTYVDGEVVDGVTTTIPVRAMVFDYLNKAEGTSSGGQTLIRTGDKQIFIQPNELFTGINPTNTIFVMAGVPYKIITVKDANPNTVDSIYYELYVRS